MITNLSKSKKINSSQKLKMIEISKSNILNAINVISIKITVIIAIQTKRENIKKKKKKRKRIKTRTTKIKMITKMRQAIILSFLML